MTDWIFRLIEGAGYFGVALLMLLETVFPPIPSEVIMPLAGVVAARGQLSLPLVILAGTIGAMIGNIAWYLLARKLGMKRLRGFVDRWGRWLTLDCDEIDKAHALFGHHGSAIVMIARVLPTIRTLISVPAGLLEMSFKRFVVWSTIGSAAWTAALAGAGYLLGRQFGRIEDVLGPLSLGIIAVIIGWYIYRVITWKPA